MNDMTIVSFGTSMYSLELHGAIMKIENDKFYYSDPLLPSGSNIYSWTSQSRFDETRFQSELPLLVENKEYQIISDIEEFPINSIFFKVVVYDYYGNDIQEFNLKSTGGRFTYPEGATKYSIHLVTKANEYIYFSWLAIAPAEALNSTELTVNRKLNETYLINQKSNRCDIYIESANSTNWIVPLQKKSSKVVIRLTNEEISDEDSIDFTFFDDIFHKLKLQKLVVNVYSYGYPLSNTIRAFKNRLIQLNEG